MSFTAAPAGVELDPPEQPFVYRLEPFRQGGVKSLAQLGFDDVREVAVEGKSSECDGCFRWSNQCQWGALTLTMDSLGGLSFDPDGFGCMGEMGTRYRLTTPDGAVVGGFVDRPTHYQNGDAVTCAYVSGDTLIVQNCGDVSSVVAIRKNQLIET
jgi:hypothetical protein